MGKTKDRLASFRNYVFDILSSLSDWMGKYVGLLLIYLGVGAIVYFMCISQNLGNSGDAMSRVSTYYAGKGEWSLGRWFWPYLDRLRFGINSSSLNSFVALMMFACGNVLIVSLFQIKSKLTAILVGALFIAAPVVCASLSYCFMSVTFGLAFLLSVLSACCALKIHGGVMAVITSGWFMAWSMGCYQAYFGVTCILLLFYFIKELFEDASKRAVGDMIFKAAGTVVIGGFIYKCMVTLVNTIHHVEFASYKDANNISLGSIIENLPHRIPEAYKEFFQFYFANVQQRTIFGLKWIYGIAFFITLCLFIYKLEDLSRRNRRNAVLCILAILLIPLASNATIILITTPNSILMTGGTALLFSLFLCLFDSFMNRKLLCLGYLCILTVLFWVNICVVNNDQIAMKEGRTTTVNLAQNIITGLIDEGYINSGNKFAFIGRPFDNPMFLVTTAYKNANAYAKFGMWGFGLNTSSNRRPWNGLFSNYCGVKFNFCSDEQYKELREKDEIKNMPCFPDKGSIRKIEGIVVVKVSDSY